MELNDLTKTIKLQLLVIILITSFLASSTTTVAAQVGSIHDQPCSVSTPCAKICGNHVCHPGEIYPPELNHNNTQNATIPSVPQGTMSQNITSKNSTLQNIPSTPLPSNIPSPRAQMESGTNLTDIKCIHGFSLVLNFLDSRPACIKSEDLTRFVARGWGEVAT